MRSSGERRDDILRGKRPDLDPKGAHKADLTLDDIDLFEINEAFAVMAEKFIRDLKQA